MPTTTALDWLSPTFVWTVINGLLSLGLTAFAVSVGYYNFKLAAINAKLSIRNLALSEQKSRLEQFDKRWAIYRRVEKFVEDVNRDGSVSWAQIMTFKGRTRTARFLFHEEVTAYIQTLIDDACDLLKTRVRREAIPTQTDERDELWAKEGKLVQRLADEGAKLADVFEYYLESRPSKPTRGSKPGQ